MKKIATGLLPVFIASVVSVPVIAETNSQKQIDKQRQLEDFRQAASKFAKKSKTDWSLTDVEDEMSGERKIFATAAHTTGTALIESKVSCGERGLNAQFTVSNGYYPTDVSSSEYMSGLIGLYHQLNPPEIGGCKRQGSDYFVAGRIKINDEKPSKIPYCVSPHYRNVAEITFIPGSLLAGIETGLWGTMMEIPTNQGPVIFYLPSADPALKEVYEACAASAKEKKASADVLDALNKMTIRITEAWRRPSGFRGGLEVYLRMSLASDGELVDVRIVKTSGDVLFDRSATSAVKRAAPFDEVKQFDEATFEEKFRSLTVKFRPED